MLLLIVGLRTLTALIALPDQVLAWRIGVHGEEDTADVLDALAPEGFIAIYDRRIPRSSANIDAIVVGPPGVFVVETKAHHGRLKVRDGDVFVRGRREGWIEQVQRQLEVVADVVEDAPLYGVIHAPNVDFPWRRVVIAGIPVVGRRGLTRVIRSHAPVLSDEQIEYIAGLIECRLRPAAPEVLALDSR